MKKYFLAVVAATLGIVALHAQEELIYNQYHFNYYLVNPALAGAEPCHSLMLTNRMQWVGMKDFPMTQLLTYKGRVWKNVGIGAYVYNDRNGYSNRAGGQATFAYHIPLSNGRKYSKKASYDRQLSFGASIKVNYFYINTNRLYADDPAAQADNAFANTSGIGLNANVGVYYKSYGGFVGLSITNLVPTTSDIYGDKELPAPLTGFLFGGYTFDLGRNRDKYLEPMAMLKMNKYLEVNMDLGLKFGQEVDRDWGYWVELSYRHCWNKNNIQAMLLMPMCSFHWKGLNVGYSFGLDLNNLVTQNGGTHEIMIGYTFCPVKHFCR
ncbi:MAG: PorP/SprF family type IX secretion system membrane protein [Paludibacteraceae bacterium]|nr:PorP/SprF family type IX secretion system membrane protein [Paludibacteraceae bacterium]